MSDIETLKSSFKGDILTPTDEGFAASLARWTVTSERTASVVTFPKHASDVTLALAYAKSHNLPIAVRGGGHSLSASSSTEGGLVIDLSRYLNTVRVDQERKLAYVGGGATWEHVDKECIKYGLATVVGTINTTGVGGLTLGGGFGWLTSSHGLTIDNLIQATLITTTSSTPLTASSTSHPDLFWAIRGGGGNFGVVTEFVLQLHTQRPKVYFGVLTFGEDKVGEVVEETGRWWARVNSKERDEEGKEKAEGESMLQLAGLGPDGNPAIFVVPFFNGTEAEGRGRFKAFLDIGPREDKTGEIPYVDVNGTLNFLAPPGLGIYIKALTLATPPSPSTFTRTLQRMLSISRSSSYHGIQSRILIDYHPPIQVDKVELGSTAFNREKKGAYNLGLHFVWEGRVDGEVVREEGGKRRVDVARELGEELAGMIVGDEKGVEGEEGGGVGYTNFDSDAQYTKAQEAKEREEGLDAKAKKAFGRNYERLREVKGVYDPQNVFRNWYPITPA